MKHFLLFVVLLIFSALPVANEAIENYFPKALTEELIQKAENNLEKLPQATEQSYLTLLNNHNNALFAFLLASEYNSILLQTEPSLVESHYFSILDMIKFRPEVLQHDPKMFLSYIAKITGSDESITPYRSEFSKMGIFELVEESKSDSELIRNINLWCRKYMSFRQTSGRDLDPLTIVNKSNLGRCEEMQILFLAAARTLGIPCRPAWTPYWGHSNSNHAWVEVLVNKHWHYLGAAEPAYNLDQAWFTNNIDKALFIESEGFYPDSLSDVIDSNKYLNYFNTTQYYSNTIRYNFSITDNKNTPIENADISILVFNFGTLLPIVNVKTDSIGKASIDLGRGSFFALAAKDSLYDFKLFEMDTLSASKNHKFVLDKSEFSSNNFTLTYPPNRKKDFPVPDSTWKKEKENAQNFYNSLIEDVSEIPLPHSYEDSDSTFREVYELAKNNKYILAEFYNNKNPKNDFWKAILKLDDKFLWEFDLNQWQNLYDFYQDIKEDGSDPDETTLTNLLEPSIFFEALPEKPCPDNLMIWRNLAYDSRIDSIAEYVNRNFKISSDSSLTGLIAFDYLYELEYLTEYQRKLLATYILKYNFVPAKYTRQPHLITIYNSVKKTWNNYNIEKKSYTNQAASKKDSYDIETEFVILDKFNQPVDLPKYSNSISTLKNGRFNFNDRQLDFDQEKSSLKGSLIPGNYYLFAGNRESGETTNVLMHRFSLNSQISAFKDTLIFQNYRQKWRNIPEKFEIFVDSLIPEDDYLILLGDFENEPVQRAYMNLKENYLKNLTFFWFGTKSHPNSPENYTKSQKLELFLSANPEFSKDVITLFFKKEQNKWFFFEGLWEVLP